MRTVLLILASMLGMTFAVAAVHAGDRDEALLMQRCPGFAAWKSAHPELSDKSRAKRIAMGPPTEPMLRRQLLAMVKADQAARDAWNKGGLKTGSGNDPVVRRLVAVDAANLKMLKPIIEKHGFPGPAQVGIDGVDAAFLLVQHAVADRAFQQHVLPQLEALYRQGLVSGQELSLLTDRTLLARGKPQRYGTQFKSDDSDPRMRLQPTEDFVHVDARRAKLGLPPLADYACLLSANYNKPVMATP